MPTSRLLRRAALALSALFLATAALAARAPQWTFIELKGPGADFTVASTANDHGEVAGWYRGPCAEVALGCTRPFVWSNGEFRTLDTPAGLPFVEVEGINARGAIVANNPMIAREVVLWKDGTWTRPGIPGQGFAINRGGDVAGVLDVANGPSRAFILRDGILFELQAPTAGSSGALALNDRGVAAGFATDSQGLRHAVTWENGALRDLGTLPGGNFSVATAINNRGVAVGVANELGSGTRAFIWDGTMRPIPGLGPGSSANAINDRGAVVGMIDSGTSYLFDDNTLTRLDTLPAVQEKGFRLLEPLAINNRGWIVGWAWRGDRDMAAFVLIPR